MEQLPSTRDRLRGYLEKRILTEQGWKYFCVGCQDYHEASKFYKTKANPWGLTSICSDHKRRNNKIKDNSEGSSHLKLSSITQKDIEATLDLLNTLGYNTYGNVHQQFMKKYEKYLKHHEEGLRSPTQSPRKSRSSK